MQLSPSKLAASTAAQMAPPSPIRDRAGSGNSKYPRDHFSEEGDAWQRRQWSGLLMCARSLTTRSSSSFEDRFPSVFVRKRKKTTPFLPSLFPTQTCCPLVHAAVSRAIRRNGLRATFYPAPVCESLFTAENSPFLNGNSQLGIPGSPFSPADPGNPSLPGSPFGPGGPVTPGCPGRP